MLRSVGYVQVQAGLRAVILAPAELLTRSPFNLEELEISDSPTVQVPE